VTIRVDTEGLSPGCMANLASHFQEALHHMTANQRVEFWEKTQEEYCKECGRDDPTCPCWNDE